MNQKQQTTDDKLVIPVANGCRPINDIAMSQYSADELNGSNGNGIKRDTRFKAGNKLGGRPKGTRNKLSEAFLADLHADWLDYGNQALTTMRQESPAKYCQMVMAILPKHIELDDMDGVTWVINASPRLTEDEWRQQHNLIESDS